MHPARILAAAVLTFAVTLNVQATPTTIDNCHVDVHCFETNHGVYAVVTVDATWGFTIDADLHLSVNNQEIKIEPFRTDSQWVMVTWIAPAGRTVNTCAHVLGRTLTSIENYLPADATDCSFFSSETRPNVPVAPPRTPVTGAPRLAGLPR